MTREFRRFSRDQSYLEYVGRGSGSVGTCCHVISSIASPECSRATVKANTVRLISLWQETAHDERAAAAGDDPAFAFVICRCTPRDGAFPLVGYSQGFAIDYVRAHLAAQPETVFLAHL